MTPDTRTTRATRATPPTVDLTPLELAAELGLSADAAPYLAKAPVRLPREWLEKWRGKTGPRELDPTDVAMILGCSARSVYRYLHAETEPRLRCREAGSGRKSCARIAPADLENYLRAVNKTLGVTPTLTETPTQSARRGRDAKARAHAALNS